MFIKKFQMCCFQLESWHGVNLERMVDFGSGHHLFDENIEWGGLLKFVFGWSYAAQYYIVKMMDDYGLGH